ncbi:cation:proton antiporter [Stella sp.]|uniref:cation:proton antiporter domain-containing protein n=1 Tax=Stella sp. TaxID=2912054 RepID=UPI0035AE06D1
MTENGHDIPYLREVLVFLAAAGIVVPVFHRLRVSPVLGFLLIGVVIGPHGLGGLIGDVPWLRHLVITDLKGVQSIAELGIVFLLFTIGLELSPRRLFSMRLAVFGMGGSAVLLCAAVLGAGAWLAGHSVAAASVLGLAFALSSTAIVMPLLAERRAATGVLGRNAFAILLFQDLAVVPILVLISVLGGGGPEQSPAAIARALGEAVLMVAAIGVFGRFALRPVLRSAARAGSPELFMAVILLVALGTAMATAAIGLSMALGAFLAGLLIAESEFRHEVEVDIEPFKGLFLGLFFIGVGMGIDGGALLRHPVPILAAVVVLFLVKGLVIGGLLRAFGQPWPVAVEAGLLLGQAGEFALVAVGLATGAHLIEAAAAQDVLLVVGLSLLATPLVAIGARRLARGIAGSVARRHEETDGVVPPPEGHVILAGFGRVGRTLAAAFEAEKIAYVAVDLDPAVSEAARRTGQAVQFGDAGRGEVLRHAGADTCQALVVTLDDVQAAERAVRAARRRWPDLPIYARARDVAHARRLAELGATEVIPEALEPSLQLAGRVMAGIGMREEAVAERLAALRDAWSGRFRA